MYVMLINDDDTITASKRERIMQRSKLFNSLWFLVAPKYNGYDMSKCTVMLEYLLPVSKKYKTEILQLSSDRYKEYLKYVLPFDTGITSEAGKIELQLTFVYTDIDQQGNGVQRVRKTSTGTLEVVPISAWSDIIPDSALSALDQRIIKTDAQIKALGDYAEALSATKADNIKYNNEKNTIRLLSGDKEIGDEVAIKACECNIEDGLPIVDFNSAGGDSGGSQPGSKDDNVVEF